MAQIYKMTLYICDLEDSLSLDEIETLIEERALNGIAVNCVCHFADSHIGKQVEWDDDIDLNQCNCPTSTWDKYFTPPTKPMTNADRIRAMSDDELSRHLHCIGWDCHLCSEHERLDNEPLLRGEKCDENCFAHCLEWLQLPAEGE